MSSEPSSSEGKASTLNNVTNPPTSAPISLIDGKYRIGAFIGKGTFGSVYIAADEQTKKEIYAVKFEQINRFDQDFLLHEKHVYQRLGDHIGVAKVWWYGEVPGYNALVMDKLGMSLAKRFSLCNYQFSNKTVCMLAIQMITRVQYLHDKDYLHRDLKPENFAMGAGGSKNDCSTVYLIDLGRARRYRNGRTGGHISLKGDQFPCGTMCYTSLNAQFGQQMSRRDDLETLGNVFVYFMKGTLPWLSAKNDKGEFDKDKMVKLKQRTMLKDLCDGLPEQFYNYMAYCRSLRFDQKPDYDYCRRLFEMLLLSQENCVVPVFVKVDGVFDWMT